MLSLSHFHVCERGMVMSGEMIGAGKFERINVTSVEVHVNNLYCPFFSVRSTVILKLAYCRVC